jgi:iron(II)-dependent oxidoreductase
VIEKPFNLELVRVPAGQFLMGSNPAKDKDAQEDEEPQHRVYVSQYYIGKYPITNTQYGSYVRSKKVDFTVPLGKDDHPVGNIRRDDAIGFCEWLSHETGQAFRLPTEAEWEKAARGTRGLLYPWGNTYEVGKANVAKGFVESLIKSFGDRTTPVGQYSPGGDSPYGAADMAGNVWEWCADGYQGDAYKKHAKSNSPVKDPAVPTRNRLGVLRGGSADQELTYARCSNRTAVPPTDRESHYGFRVIVRLAPVS